MQSRTSHVNLVLISMLFSLLSISQLKPFDDLQLVLDGHPSDAEAAPELWVAIGSQLLAVEVHYIVRLFGQLTLYIYIINLFKN